LAVLTMFTAILAFGAFMAGSSLMEKTVRDYYGKAIQYAAVGEYQKAADLFEKYLNKYPDNKNAMTGYLSAVRMTDKAAARDWARKMLGSGLLTSADFPYFAELCAGIGDRELSVEAYAFWLQLSPGHIGAMVELAKAYIADGSTAALLDIMQCMFDADYSEVAAVLLRRAVERASKSSAPPREVLKLCEAWNGAEGENVDALLALAGAYADNGMGDKAEDAYRRALGLNVKSAAAYDGILRLLYQNERLRDRYDLLDMAVRNVGGAKYKDMMESTRGKMAEYYSTVREDGVTYRDGIFRITPYDPDGNQILAGSASLFGADETSYAIEYYDNLGIAKEMFLDCARIQTQIADVDYDGIREVLIKRYVTADGMSVEAMRGSFWHDVFRIDRDINKLIYSTPQFANYYKNTYVPSINRKLAQFERLSEAMEGHYGVTYGFLYALKSAALDFANGEWTPDNTGANLRSRLCQTLIVPELEKYVSDKQTIYGKSYGDHRVTSGDFDEAAAAEALALEAAISAAAEAAVNAATAINAATALMNATAASTLPAAVSAAAAKSPAAPVGWASEGGLYPGMTESYAVRLLGAPRYVTEEEMKAVRPDGKKVTYLNRILEYSKFNLYVSDGIVKAIRINSREAEGPRSLRIGDTTWDIVNKFPSSYFDDIANFHKQKANAEIEFMDVENGAALNYIVKNGIIMGIELYIRDSSGDWKPGTNITTVITTPENE